MRKITDLFFLIEGALIGGFSLNGYLSYNCGGDVLCICIISIIFFILAIVNFIINNNRVGIVVSYFYVSYSILLGIYLTLIAIILTCDKMISILLLLLIMPNCYLSFRNRKSYLKSDHKVS